MTSTTMISGLRAIVQRPRLSIEQRIELEEFWRKTTERGELPELYQGGTTLEVAEAMYRTASHVWRTATDEDVFAAHTRLIKAHDTVVAARAELPARCGACRDLSFTHNYGPGCTATPKAQDSNTGVSK